jgi:hypothetical protein
MYRNVGNPKPLRAAKTQNDPKYVRRRAAGVRGYYPLTELFTTCREGLFSENHYGPWLFRSPSWPIFSATCSTAPTRSSIFLNPWVRRSS